MDWFTKWIKSVSLKFMAEANVAELLLNEWVINYSSLEERISDTRKYFRETLFKDAYQIHNTQN